MSKVIYCIVTERRLEGQEKPITYTKISSDLEYSQKYVKGLKERGVKLLSFTEYLFNREIPLED